MLALGGVSSVRPLFVVGRFQLDLAQNRVELFGQDHLQPEWTAIVLAGERPGGDPLADELDMPMKALIRIRGTTLLDHVLAPLLKVPRIKRIIVLAQNTETLSRADPLCLLGHDRVSLFRSGNGIATSIAEIAGTSVAPWPVFVTTADNALLTQDRVETFLDQAHDSDIAIGVGERKIVEREFPGTKRTWLKFSDGHFSGANLFAFSSPRCLDALNMWSMVESDRKKGLKLIASFGPALLLRALTRTIAFSAAIEKASSRLGCTARPIVLDAEAPIDVDKMADLELVGQILESRMGTSPRAHIAV